MTKSEKAVLVTGEAGYIGSHACKALSRAGYLPVTYDNLVYGHERAVRWGLSNRATSLIERGSMRSCTCATYTTPDSLLVGDDTPLRWLRLFGQFFRFDKWRAIGLMWFPHSRARHLDLPPRCGGAPAGNAVRREPQKAAAASWFHIS
jgi:hypothetical protein